MQNSDKINNAEEKNNSEYLNVKKDRIIFLDILRILATIAVIFIHVAAQNWSDTDPTSYEWNVFNVYDSITRWAVPVFVMISGALFLDNSKKIDIKRLYKNNILRIITALVFWSCLYAIIEFILKKENFVELIKNIINGHYHLWFLYMIVGLYIIVPILRKITENQRVTEYFLALSLIFTFIIPSLLEIPIFSDLVKIRDNIGFYLTLGYSSYFVLGYWLSQKKFQLKTKKIIYFFSVLGFIITILGSTIISKYKMQPFGLYNEFLPNVLLESIGVFIFIKNFALKNKFKYENKIYKLSKYSFGIYLVHVLIIGILKKAGINTLMINPIISVPVIAIIVFIISLIISMVMNNIPILKKYIV